MPRRKQRQGGKRKDAEEEVEEEQNSEEEQKEEAQESNEDENENNSEDEDISENSDDYKKSNQKKQESKPEGVQLSKAEIRKIKKQKKAGKMTKEDFDKKMGTFKAEPTEEEKNEILKAAEYADALQGYKARKGEVDTNSKDIRVEQFTLAYKSNTLLKDADLLITNGRKYGLIGPNGTGKSTLLRHISQRHLPVPKHISILHVEQEVEGTDTPALQAVLEADVERLELLKEEHELKKISKENTEAGLAAADRLIEIYSRMKAIGVFSAEARAAAILSGLQFTHEMQKKPTKEFSGGWRMRIALARALFVMPDLLLLDEPTNHLDLDAVIWLEAYLRRYKKTLLLVSHDREFLNGVITDIICLRHQTLEYYKGNYDTFERALEAKKKQKAKKVKVEKKAIDRMHEKQDKTSKEKVEKMKKDGLAGRVEKDYIVKFIFKNPGPLSFPVIQIKKSSFSYKPDKPLFENIELNVDCESKIAIVGPNGTGKSTLMNLILGELKPTKGEIIRNRHLRVAKFSQHFVDQLTMTETPVQYLHKRFPLMKEQDIRNKLGMYNLKGAVHNQPISLLSGGQKSRVAVCEIGLKEPHILFLDEPTNHLDIQSVDALSQALQAFEGGVVLITHDQRLVSTVSKELWVCRGDKRVEIYDGEFQDYKQEIINQMPDELFISDDES